jgi:hypothetical protein
MNLDSLRSYLGEKDLRKNEVSPGWTILQQGAATSVLLATSPLLKGVRGRYFDDCSEAVIVAGSNVHMSGRVCEEWPEILRSMISPICRPAATPSERGVLGDPYVNKKGNTR